jgi:hypothetical protein
MSGGIGANVHMNRFHDNIGAVESIYFKTVDICPDFDVVGDVYSDGIVNDATQEIHR